MLNIKSILRDSVSIYAHEGELLERHISECNSIFNIINKEYNLIDRLIHFLQNISIKKMRVGKTIESRLSDIEVSLVVEMVKDSVALHDIGKINPKFQLDKFQNYIIPTVEEGYNPSHAPISSYIFLNEYINIIEQDSLIKNKNILIYIAMLCANAIYSHHGKLHDFNDIFGDNINNTFSFIDSKNYLFAYKSNYRLPKDLMEVQRKALKSLDGNEMDLYIWNKVIYSILITCDFIATHNHYSKDKGYEINGIDNLDLILEKYNDIPVAKGIAEYSVNKSYFKDNNLPLINELRSEISMTCVENIENNIDSHFFNLEAPTGSGKTYTSIAASLKLLTNLPKKKRKLFYVFPANTISNQTKKVLDDAFGDSVEINEVNSITPLPIREKNGEIDYQKTLLDRQLLNYPITLTSNINLFNVLFGTGRENALALLSLSNSIIILDEIQNYKNIIWKEIIEFLYKYADILNIKVIIMSATLPNLEDLLDSKSKHFVSLLPNSRLFYDNPLFKNRVKIDARLLEEKVSFDRLTYEMKSMIENRNKKHKGKTKFLVEFINKKTASEYYEFIKSVFPLSDYDIYELDGDDNQFNRNAIISKCKNNNISKNIILVTTQIIEAGVDIDMDLGAKDIAFADTDEQFLGRINRSCTKEDCIVLLFKLDRTENVYRGDLRSNLINSCGINKHIECLESKNFNILYNCTMDSYIKAKNNGLISPYSSFIKKVANLSFREIYSHMKLIDSITYEVYIPTVIELEGARIDGAEIWNEYLSIINSEEPYSKKRYDLAALKKCLNLFTFSVYKEPNIEPVGGLYYIEDGEKYMINGKLNAELFKNNF